MARIVPSDLTRLALSGAHEPEIKTLKLLKSALPDQYTVFHGVHWTRQYQGATVFGEIDFIIINQAGDLLCIEQKNGRLLEKDNHLLKQYGTEEKNVADQLHRSLRHLRQKFQNQSGGDRLEVDYLVYIPNYAVKTVSAVGIDSERIVDSSRRENLSEIIQEILSPGTENNEKRFQQVSAFLRQSFDVIPDVHTHIEAQQCTYTRLSGGLAEVVENFEMSPMRLRILATAGNGKTLVATRIFNRAVARGRRPLLLCFNRPLAERLKRLVPAKGMVETWYGFCDQFLQSRDVRLNFDDMHSDPQFWDKVEETVEELLMDTAPEQDWKFQTLVIDEAQDFEPAWMEIVKLFLDDDADIICLEDPNQNLRSVEDRTLQEQGFVSYRSLTNYRTPVSIAGFIQAVMPAIPFNCANDLPGLGVDVTTYCDPMEQHRLVAGLVGQLITKRFQQNQIAVLSCRGLGNTAFRDVTRIGNRTLSRFTRDYDQFGNQISTEGEILFDTVRRFKGQQQAAVILVDVDPDLNRLEEELRVLFCGMTRATVRLEIVCRESNSWVGEHLLPRRAA